MKFLMFLIREIMDIKNFHYVYKSKDLFLDRNNRSEEQMEKKSYEIKEVRIDAFYRMQT